MREVVGATQPDMQRRMLDIKKYFFDILHERLGGGGVQDGVVEEGVLADVNISSIPHIFDGKLLPHGNI